MRAERSTPMIWRTDDRSHTFAPGEHRRAIPPRPSMTMDASSALATTDTRQFGTDAITVMSVPR